MAALESPELHPPGKIQIPSEESFGRPLDQTGSFLQLHHPAPCSKERLEHPNNKYNYSLIMK